MSLLGQVGAATSMLRPSGMAKFGDRYVDVVTEGDLSRQARRFRLSKWKVRGSW